MNIIKLDRCNYHLLVERFSDFCGNNFKDMRPRMSPLSVRSSKIQDTSFTTTDTEEAVAKISSLFPTVSETHIKLLLKK